MNITDWTVDRMNPVVLRESRQLVRSRFAMGIMLSFLLIMVVSSAMYVVTMNDTTQTSFHHGKNLFNILYYILGYASLLFIPAHTALPFWGQQRSKNMDLLFTSTISSRSIIWGKMTSSFWMLMLLFSVSMPFMVLTILLRGIGFFEVLLNLAMLAGLILLATMALLLLVCLPISRVFLGLLCLGFFFILLIFPSFTTEISRNGARGDAIGTFLFVTAIVLPILGALATALISPSVSNRALSVRFTITICWIIAGIAAWLAPSDASEVWVGLSVFGAATAMLASSSDASQLSRRIQRTVPKNRLLRIIAFPFFNGPFSGWIWCFMIGMLSIVATWGNLMEGEYTSLLFYALAYSLMAAWVRRAPFIQRICPEKYTWAIAGLLLAIASILPLLANFIMHPGSSSDLMWEVGNPFAAFDDNAQTHMIFSGCFCLLMLILNIRWLGRQIKAFRPLEATITVNEAG